LEIEGWKFDDDKNLMRVALKTAPRIDNNNKQDVKKGTSLIGVNIAITSY